MLEQTVPASTLLNHELVYVLVARAENCNIGAAGATLYLQADLGALQDQIVGVNGDEQASE